MFQQLIGIDYMKAMNNKETIHISLPEFVVHICYVYITVAKDGILNIGLMGNFKCHHRNLP